MNSFRPPIQTKYVLRILLVLLLALVACIAIWLWFDAQTQRLKQEFDQPHLVDK